MRKRGRADHDRRMFLSAVAAAGGFSATNEAGAVDRTLSRAAPPQNVGADAVNFLQFGSMAVSRSVQDKLRDGWAVSIKDFGAACDDTTDDTAAFQAAIDSVGDTSELQRSGIYLVIPGPTRITKTVKIRRKSIILQGLGWGHRGDAGTRASWIRWDGASGVPMIQVQDVKGFSARDLHLVGKSSAKPSAGINFNETNDGWPLTSNSLENIYIGALPGEVDDTVQFTHGILLDGTGINNSEHVWSNIKINKVESDGIHVGSIQNCNINVRGFFAGSCGRAALYNSGQVTINGCSFSSNAVDFFIPKDDDNGRSVNAITHVTGYFSETAGRLAEMTGSGQLIINGNSFSISSQLNADGKVIKAEGSIGVGITIRDFRLRQAGVPAVSPYLSLGPGTAGSRFVSIDNIQNWALLTGGKSGMDIASSGVAARSYVYLRDNPQTFGLGYPVRITQNQICGQSGQQWTPHRFDVLDDMAIKLFDDFLGDVLADQWGCQVGSNAKVVAPAVLIGHPHTGGIVRMTTGDDAVGSMDINGVHLSSSLNWRANQCPLVLEARIRLNAITNVAVYVGLTDQVVALEMPFTLANDNALTSNTSDGVGWLFDTGAETHGWWLVGCSSNVDATKQNSGLAPVAGIFEVLRVEIEGAAATFFRNGVKVGTQMSGAVSGAMLTPVLAAFSRGPGSRNIDVDYILVQSQRSYP